MSTYKKFNQIQSLDPAILHDQLLAVLQRSPQTVQHVGMRVNEIIIQILSIPIIQQLQQQIQEMKQMMQKVEEQKKIVSMSHSKESTKKMNMLEKYRMKNKQLQKQIKILRQVEEERNNYMIQIQQLQKSNMELTGQNTKLKIECDRNKEQINKNNTQIIKLQQQIDNSKKANEDKDSKIKSLQLEVDKVKKLCKETKYQEIRFKKEGQKIQQDYEIAFTELNKLRDQLAIERVHRDNERKALNIKITELYKKSKNAQKAKKKLLKILSQQKGLQSDMQTLKKQFISTLQVLNQHCTSKTKQILDEVGQQVHKQLKQLLSQINKNTNEQSIYRQEIRIKDEIIQKLQKVSSVQLMGNRQLQKQLKFKKMEADSLRKELKKNYQQSEIKFMGLENCYRQIVDNSANQIR